MDSKNGYGIFTVGLADTWWVNTKASGNHLDNWHITNGSGSRYISCKGETSITGKDWAIIGFTGFTGTVTFDNCNATNTFDISGAGTGFFRFINPIGGVFTSAGSNILIGAPLWIPMGGLSNGWTAAAGRSAPSYRLKSPVDLQIIGGFIAPAGIVTGQTIFTLPNAYQPNLGKSFSGRDLNVTAGISVQFFLDNSGNLKYQDSIVAPGDIIDISTLQPLDI